MHFIRHRFRLETVREPKNQVCEVFIRQRHFPTVEGNERRHRDKRSAFVAVDEGLALRYPVSEDGRLTGQVGSLVSAMVDGPRDSALQRSMVAQLIPGHDVADAEDATVDPDDIVEV